MLISSSISFSGRSHMINTISKESYSQLFVASSFTIKLIIIGLIAWTYLIQLVVCITLVEERLFKSIHVIYRLLFFDLGIMLLFAN